jgi:hypothetical protein
MADLENSNLKPTDEILEDILPDENLEENFEEKENPLSLRQIIVLSLSGFLGLVFFTLTLFPIEEIIHYYLTKNSQTSNVLIDFKKLNFPILGTKSVDSLYVVTKDNIEIRSEEVQFSLDLSEMYKGNIISQSEIYAFSIETNDVYLSSKSIQADVQLIQSEREVPTYNGTISFTSSGGKLGRIPSFPILGDLSGTSIKSMTLNLKKNGSRITFDKTVLDLSIAKIQIKGRMDLMPNFKNSKLELEICPKLSKEFSSERQDISDMLTLMVREGKEPCIPLQGTISSPKLNINLNVPGTEPSPEMPPSTP